MVSGSHKILIVVMWSILFIFICDLENKHIHSFIHSFITRELYLKDSITSDALL